MTSIGDTLRSERQRRGWTLQQVANEIKVNTRLLAAIEEDAVRRLPCAMLARSFVRQYARAMCVDEQEAVAQIDRQFAEAGLPTSLPEFKDRSSAIPLLPPLADVRKRIERESSLAALVWLALACFVCATAYTSLRRHWDSGAVAAESHEATPVNNPKAAAEPRATAPAYSNAAAAEPPATAPAYSNAAAAELSATTLAYSKATAAESHATTPAYSETGAANRATSSPVRALFTATEPVWISVSADGAPIYTGTLQAQQSRQFEGAGKMIVTVGNAGGVIVTLNDKPVGPIGLSGQVRLLELTPDGAVFTKSPAN